MALTQQQLGEALLSGEYTLVQSAWYDDGAGTHLDASMMLNPNWAEPKPVQKIRTRKPSFDPKSGANTLRNIAQSVLNDEGRFEIVFYESEGGVLTERIIHFSLQENRINKETKQMATAYRSDTLTAYRVLIIDRKAGEPVLVAGKQFQIVIARNPEAARTAAQMEAGLKAFDVTSGQYIVKTWDLVSWEPLA